MKVQDIKSLVATLLSLPPEELEKVRGVNVLSYDDTINMQADIWMDGENKITLLFGDDGNYYDFCNNFGCSLDTFNDIQIAINCALEDTQK